MFHFDNGLFLTRAQLAVDVRRRQPRAFVSHAHTDHIARHELALATPATGQLYRHRLGQRYRVQEMRYGEPLEFGGLRLTALPAGFTAPREGEGRLELDAPLDGVDGTAALWIEPRAEAVNLVAETRRFGEQAAAEPGGEFHGGSELVTGYGPAFTARAAIESGAVEERRTFLLHPDGSERLLVVSLRYPPGGAEVSRARLQQVLELLSAMEPADASG